MYDFGDLFNEKLFPKRDTLDNHNDMAGDSRSLIEL